MYLPMTIYSPSLVSTECGDVFLMHNALITGATEAPERKNPLFGVRCISLLYHKQLNKPYTLEPTVDVSACKTNRIY
jgi:hypothetical protein